MTIQKTSRVVVIPCFNEERRLNPVFFVDLVNTHACELIFVDDGSTDNTYNVISSLPLAQASFEIIRLDKNRGKANAIRVGLNHALIKGYEFIGLYDADGAIHPQDMGNAFQIIGGSTDINVVSGARILLAGNNVSRLNHRRWMGRIIATLVSLIMGLQIYDPQSPCKVYRASCLAVISKFNIKTKWFVDAEILKFLSREQDKSSRWLVEFPVTNWKDVAGSNISCKSSLRVLQDLFILISK
jgi:glycosyltransferase involved in cell wall biosynthesis